MWVAYADTFFQVKMPRKDPKEEAKPTKKNVKEEFDDYFNEEVCYCVQRLLSFLRD